MEGVDGMNILFPIRKKFSDLIFSGLKDLEFRKTKVKVEPGELCFIYETKGGNPGGCGKVVGFFECGGVEEIPYHKVGTYAMLQHFLDRAMKEPDVFKNLIDTRQYEPFYDVIARALSIRFESTDESYVLHLICDEKAIKIMEDTGRPLDTMDLYDLMKDWKRYENCRQLSSRLCDKCDEWLRSIGYYNDDDKSYWSHSISIKNPKLIEPIDINELSLYNGQRLKAAPQSFCYINVPNYKIRE